MTPILSNSIRFIVLVLIQVLLLNHLDFGSASPYLTPYLYLLFILLLPVDLSPPTVMGLSVLTGLVLDMFCNTYGLHASATLFAGYLRLYVLNALAPREGYDTQNPDLFFTMGLRWKATYFGILVLAHHFWFFFVEVFRLSGLFDTFLRAFTSSLFTLALMLLSVYLVYKPAYRR